MDIEREVLEADVVIVGAGPAGLSAALHLANLYEAHNAGIDAGEVQGEKLDVENLFVLEKGAEVGAHALSGAVMDPVALKELVPDYEEKGFPSEATVASEKIYYLTPTGTFGFPVTPPPMKNHGNLIVSLNKVVKWLAEAVEEKGVNILPGFPAAEVLYEDGKVVGVRSGDMGVAVDGSHKPNFEAGTDIRARITLFAEGPRGHLMKALTAKMDLKDIGPDMASKYGYTRGWANPQAFATGIKEIWQLREEVYNDIPDVIHTMGYPLPTHTFGGSWLYKMKDNHISLGLVAGLDSPDPLLDPHTYFQLFKNHPFLKSILEGAKLVRYGAKTISEGGNYSIPKLALDNTMVIGESGGLVNVPRLKGIHYAMKSGMMAAEQAVSAFRAGDLSEAALKPYEHAVRDTTGQTGFIGREIHRYRLAKAHFKNGFWGGMVKAGLQEMLGGWWLGGQPEMEPDAGHILKLSEFSGHSAQKLWEAGDFKYDNEKLLYDRLTGVYNSGTVHEEDQPCHLVISPEDVAGICNDRCTKEYGNPCRYFCPAEVYEMVEESEGSTDKVLKLNPSNCVHCKTCDIRDPYGVITWVTPEGGGGPDYASM